METALNPNIQLIADSYKTALKPAKGQNEHVTKCSVEILDLWLSELTHCGFFPLKNHATIC